MEASQPARRPGRWSLARQLLAGQLVTVGLLLLAVAAVSLAQSARDIRRVESRRALMAAESVAASAVVRSELANVTDSPTGDGGNVLAAAAESARSVSDSDGLILVDAKGLVVTSSDPREIGEPFADPGSPALRGRAWTGLSGPYVTAQVPVLADDGSIVGLVAVLRDHPNLRERISLSRGDLLTYLGIAAVLGVAGSSLLARRVKRQTLGLEPGEITRLAQDRDAMLQGMREGVLGLDPELRVTLLNEPAAGLLGLPVGSVGRHLDDLDLDERTKAVLRGEVPGQDLPVVLESRFLVVNRVPVAAGGRDLGSVTTLRDRSELIALQQELGATRSTTDLLRAQTHEFANRLHTISGLIQLGEYDTVTTFVDTLQRRRAGLDQQLTSSIEDPAVAALLLAKTSVATERRLTLRIHTDTRLRRLDDTLSADVSTVVGNLVDNGMDAAGEGGWVEVLLKNADEDAVLLEVRDSGAGVDPGMVEQIFRKGFSTKDAGGPAIGARGIGLALTRVICERRGGWVRVQDQGAGQPGALFSARLGTNVRSEG